MQNRINLIKNSTRSFKTPRLKESNNLNKSVNVGYGNSYGYNTLNQSKFPEPSKRSLNNHGLGKRNKNRLGSMDNDNGQNLNITESGHTNLKPNNMMRTIDD